MVKLEIEMPLSKKKMGVAPIIHQNIKDQPIPGLAAKIDEIEHITVFINGREYEFVACQ